MIAVRIPEEIRKYKEKIMFGLNARQLICTILALAICVPLYFFGRKYITDDTLSWLIILIASPLLSVGYLKLNGMPMEKFAIAFAKFNILYPMKRKYKSKNAFRTWQNQAIKEDLPKTNKERRKAAKMELEASLERSVLLEEAEERGEKNFDVNQAELITVNMDNNGNKPENNKNDKKKGSEKDTKKPKKSNLQIQAEEIEAKIRADAHYLPTEKENKIRRKWNLELQKQRKQEVIQKKKVVNAKITG